MVAREMGQFQVVVGDDSSSAGRDEAKKALSALSVV
jgi:hypothetical protein